MVKICIVCNKEYDGHGNSTCCSKECKVIRGNDLRRAIKRSRTSICVECGYEFNNFEVGRRKYCSTKCQKEADAYQQKKRLRKWAKSKKGKDTISKWNQYRNAKDRVFRRRATRSRLRYTDEEIKLILDSKLTNQEVALETGRTINAIRRKRSAIKNNK